MPPNWSAGKLDDYDGVLSSTREWHATAVGSSTGLFSAALWVSGFQVPALLVMGAIAVVALGIEGKARIDGIKVPNLGNKKVKKQVRREPWYAMGSMMAFFLVGLALLGVVL